jgi:hypothetical protein
MQKKLILLFLQVYGHWIVSRECQHEQIAWYDTFKIFSTDILSSFNLQDGTNTHMVIMEMMVIRFVPLALGNRTVQRLPLVMLLVVE